MRTRHLTLREMAEIQTILNEYTVPNWRTELTSNDFKTAMFDEFAELLNSGSWKWWKHSDTPVDTWNLKIEAIDILHFALSIYICDNTINGSADLVLGEFNKPNAYMVNDNKIDRNVFINKACAVLTSNNPVVLDDFFDSVGLLSEEISAIYTAKSELNYIRQSAGYKNGTYIKIQDGVEDNVRLQDLVEDFLSDSDAGLTDLRDMVRSEFFTGADEDTKYVFIEEVIENGQAKEKESEEENHY